MTLSSTHTYALLPVSWKTYDEIFLALQEAGYDHAIFKDGGRVVIDMHGIALARKELPYE